MLRCGGGDKKGVRKGMGEVRREVRGCGDCMK